MDGLGLGNNPYAGYDNAGNEVLDKWGQNIAEQKKAGDDKDKEHTLEVQDINDAAKKAAAATPPKDVNKGEGVGAGAPPPST